MNDQPSTPADFTQEISVQKNKLSVIGFILMLSGPLVLLLASLTQKLFGDLSEILANIISWTAMIVPGIGAVICIICLFSWKKLMPHSRALSIVTVIMCNPFFYYIYLFICAISSKTLAGLNWM